MAYKKEHVKRKFRPVPYQSLEYYNTPSSL